MKTSDILALAKSHAIKHELAAPDFFEGALMGNGDLGVITCTRPGGIVFYFGHNDIWDISFFLTLFYKSRIVFLCQIDKPI